MQLYIKIPLNLPFNYIENKKEISQVIEGIMAQMNGAADEIKQADANVANTE